MRPLPYIFVLMSLLILAGCASMEKSIEVTNENSNDLPSVADMADPGAARIIAAVQDTVQEGNQLYILLEINEVKAIGRSAPPLKPGKLIEMAIPGVQWARQTQQHPNSTKTINCSIKYQGKARHSQASSAWHWISFH